MSTTLRSSARSLLRSPRVTLLTVLTLALGVGAASAFWSVYDAVLLRPLAYGDAAELVAVLQPGRSPTSPANFLDLRARSATLRNLVAASPWAPVLRGEGPPEQLPGLKVSSELFTLLRVPAALGRTFAPEDVGERVLVLGHELWQSRFGADTKILGRRLDLDGEAHEVIGVMPAGFHFPPFWATEARYWALHLDDPEMWQERDSQFLRVFARLAPGMELGAAQAEVDTLSAALAAEHPDDNEDLRYVVEPLSEPVVEHIRPALSILFGGVGLVLAIACANVFGLWLTRAGSQRRELALRRALGAGRGHLWLQGLSESLLVVALACGLGWILALWGLETIQALAPPEVPRLGEAGLDHRTFFFTLGVGGLLALLVGQALPIAAGRNPATELGGAGAHAGDRRSSRGRTLLVAFEVTLSLVLLLASGVMAKSLLQLWRLDPGMRTEGVLTSHLPFGGSEVAPAEAQNAFFDGVLERVRAQPGVERAALINHLHLGGDIWNSGYAVEGQTAGPPEGKDEWKASFRVVSEGLFETLEIPLLDGRAFEPTDDADAPRVVVVNRSFAERHWPEDPAVGRRIRGVTAEQNWLEIVGVVGDVKQWSLTQETRPEIYFPYRQNPVPWWTQTSLVVTTGGDPQAVQGAVASGLREVRPALAMAQPRTLRQIYGQLLWQPRFSLSLLALFAAAASALAVVGIYGSLSYAAAARRRELGVRLALGARRRDLTTLLLRRGMAGAVAGIGLGIGLFLGLARVLESQLYRVSPYDPSTLLLVAAGLAAASLVAAYLPARRASRIDPVSSLRME